MDFEKIQKLIAFIEKSEITGLSVEEDGVKIEVRKEISRPSVPPLHEMERRRGGEVVADDKVKAQEEELPAVISPMVGTFYRAASPDSPPFVDVGDKVDASQVVCIIEAMKLFNEIESEVKGEIVKILVQNGEPVEYGQKLMLVRPLS